MKNYKIYFECDKYVIVTREKIEEYLLELTKLSEDDLYILSNTEIDMLYDAYYDDIITYCYFDLFLEWRGVK